MRKRRARTSGGEELGKGSELEVLRHVVERRIGGLHKREIPNGSLHTSREKEGGEILEALRNQN
jgi:hypothetical protein